MMMIIIMVTIIVTIIKIISHKYIQAPNFLLINQTHYFKPKSLS